MAASDNKISVAVAVAAGVAVLYFCLPAVRADNFDTKYGRHNITMGQRRYSNYYPYQPLDMLLFQDTPKVDGSWLPYPKVQSHDVCYPPKGSNPRKFSITAFNVTDQVPNGQGGYAYITAGGVNWGKLCLHLKTQRGKGYFFNITILGYYI